jgi:TfoX/Sxy family transcriptional regulator of competence genes
MKLQKAPQSLIDLFDSALPEDQRLEKRSLFGFPAAFVHGNMICGIHGNSCIVRLDPVQREGWLKNKAILFEPMPGRPMKEYIVVPADVLSQSLRLKSLLQLALDYGLTLPPKQGKKKTPKKR